MIFAAHHFSVFQDLTIYSIDLFVPRTYLHFLYNLHFLLLIKKRSLLKQLEKATCIICGSFVIVSELLQILRSVGLAFFIHHLLATHAQIVVGFLIVHVIKLIRISRNDLHENFIVFIT